MAGFEDIYCIDVDDTKSDEVWFIFNDRHARIFQKTALLSMQEVSSINPEEWKKFVRRMNPRSYGNS
jgi:hypothetical protein